MQTNKPWDLLVQQEDFVFRWIFTLGGEGGITFDGFSHKNPLCQGKLTHLFSFFTMGWAWDGFSHTWPSFSIIGDQQMAITFDPTIGFRCHYILLKSSIWVDFFRLYDVPNGAILREKCSSKFDRCIFFHWFMESWLSNCYKFWSNHWNLLFYLLLESSLQVHTRLKSY